MKRLCALSCGLLALLIVSCGDESTGTDTSNLPDNAVADDTVADDEVPSVDEDAAVVDEEVKDENDLKDETVDEDVTTTDELLPDEDGDGELPDDTDPNCQPGAYPEVCGSWAQQMIFNANAVVFGIDAASAEIKTLFRMTQRQQGGQIWIDSKICHIAIISSPDILQINMPQSFADGLIMLHKEADITLAGEYYQPTYWEMRSIKQSILPSDPGTYELPTDPNSPDVEDWDNDSIPGLRVVVTGTMNGTTHIVEKSSSELWGQVKGSGQDQTIDGTVYWTDKQVVLSVTESDPFSAAGLKKGAQNVINQEKDNIWRQVRIPENWTCAEVVANGETLFPD